MIKIVLPPAAEGCPAITTGTKVFNSDGSEITNITRIEIDITPDNVVTAKLHVAVSAIENLDAHPMLARETVEAAAKWHGLLPLPDSGSNCVDSKTS